MNKCSLPTCNVYTNLEYCSPICKEVVSRNIRCPCGMYVRTFKSYELSTDTKNRMFPTCSTLCESRHCLSSKTMGGALSEMRFRKRILG